MTRTFLSVTRTFAQKPSVFIACSGMYPEQAMNTDGFWSKVLVTDKEWNSVLVGYVTIYIYMAASNGPNRVGMRAVGELETVPSPHNKSNPILESE